MTPSYNDLYALFLTFGAAIIVAAIIGIVMYVLYGISHMKALKLMGYKNAWAAWVPFYSDYALADCVPEFQDTVKVLGLSVPGKLFKFWWAIVIALQFIPTVGTILGTALTIICAGKCYISIYSALEGVPEENTKVIGYLSGWLNIIAIVKFFSYKK